jgi:uncharacterized phiE125 gp8 family phage protein
LNFKKTTDSVGLAVPLDDVKTHLKVNNTVEDSLITTLIGAATSWAEYYTEQSILAAEYTLTLDKFPSGDTIKLKYGPVTAITSFTYIDEDGAEQTLVEGTDFLLDDSGNIPRIQRIADDWPEVEDRVNAISIVYDVGFASVPDDIVAGIKMLVGHLYENRQDAVVSMTASSMPFASKHLFHKYRVYLDAC